MRSPVGAVGSVFGEVGAPGWPGKVRGGAEGGGAGGGAGGFCANEVDAKSPAAKKNPKARTSSMSCRTREFNGVFLGRDQLSETSLGRGSVPVKTP